MVLLEEDGSRQLVCFSVIIYQFMLDNKDRNLFHIYILLMLHVLGVPLPNYLLILD